MDPAFPRAAREIFIFGENYEGYWTCELLLENVRKAAAIELLECGCEDLQVRRMVVEMGKMDKVMENMTQLLENMSKMTSTMADALATIRSMLSSQVSFYPRGMPFKAGPPSAHLPACHG